MGAFCVGKIEPRLYIIPSELVIKLFIVAYGFTLSLVHRSIGLGVRFPTEAAIQLLSVVLNIVCLSSTLFFDPAFVSSFCMPPTINIITLTLAASDLFAIVFNCARIDRVCVDTLIFHMEIHLMFP